MVSLQGHMPDSENETDNQRKEIHNFNIENGSFPKVIEESIEGDDVVQFNVNENDAYDIFQVYKNGDNYYRVDNGYQLLNINRNTPMKDRRILLSFAPNKSDIKLYFCIIQSSRRREIIPETMQQCPKNNCENNYLLVQKPQIKFDLNDERCNQKVYLCPGDAIEIEWKAQTGVGYRIEEKKYCPVSGGLYTVSDSPLVHHLSSGKFSKTFDEFGTSFLFRITDKNQLHDITTCIVNDTYKIKRIEITDDSINPIAIWIEQNDWIAFHWNTKCKQTIVEIEPFTVCQLDKKSIEVCIL